MKNLLRKHPDTVLIIIALILLGTIIAYFVWGIGAVVTAVDRGVDTNVAPAGSITFDLKDAEMLDLRGLVKPSP